VLRQVQQRQQRLVKTISAMEAFVRQHEGSKAIHKVLIANNGIAAVKVSAAVASSPVESWRVCIEHYSSAYVRYTSSYRPRLVAPAQAIRSIRKFCYEFIGDEHAVQFVVMATPEDMSVNAEFIRCLSIVPHVVASLSS
jgi:hypothetical protein